MITEENKLFLKEKFNIDSDKYTEEQLSKLLDNINLEMKNIIQKKTIELNNLKSQLYNLMTEEN